MLFLGLGTGLGSAMIVDGVLEPMEVAHLPYKKGRTFEYYLGVKGLKHLGKKKWRRHVADVVGQLKNALEADYVVLGGGNAKLLKELPPDARLGDNSTAFIGGYRLWEEPGAQGKWKKGADRTVREIPSAQTPKETSGSSEALPVDNAF
jgi:hypothetical protein